MDEGLSEADKDLFEIVYTFVRNVPPGKVVTYGQVAESVTGAVLTARQVGHAMRFAPNDVPWQRVVGAGGHLPIARRSPQMKLLQRRLLEQDGVAFLPNADDQVDMSRFQWLPDPPSTAQGSLFDSE